MEEARRYVDRMKKQTERENQAKRESDRLISKNWYQANKESRKKGLAAYHEANKESWQKASADWMKGGWWNWLSQYFTFPLRERSERVGLSACVKHGHVVPSKNCKWLPFD